MRRLSLSRTLEVNDFVDCVLSTVYKSIKSSHPSSSSSSPNGADSTPAHRRIVLSSFNPVVCTALNWKQPNFSVFFASFCGLSRSASGAGVGVAVVDGQPGKLVPANRVEDDRRCTSIREAVKFAKANNLLGIMLEATMLVRRHSVLSSPRPRPGAGGGADSSPHPQVQIPSLIQSAREHGLLITTFGTASRVVLADAHMTDGVCVRSSLSPVSSSAPLIREPSRLSYATSDFLAQTAAS